MGLGAPTPGAAAMGCSPTQVMLAERRPTRSPAPRPITAPARLDSRCPRALWSPSACDSFLPPAPPKEAEDARAEPSQL